MVRRAAAPIEKASARLIAAARAADPDPRAMPCAPAPVPGTPRRSRPSTSWPVMRRHWTSARREPAATRPAAEGGRRSGRCGAFLRQAWRLRPDDFWVNYDLAYAVQPEEAVRHLTAAIAIRPGSNPAQTYLGNTLSAQRKHDEAIAEYRTAIRLHPGYVLAHHNLGNALRTQGRHEAAIAAYRTATRLQPDLAAAHHNLGLALPRSGEGR